MLLFMAVFQLSANNGYAQRTNVPVSVSNVTVEQVLNQIEKSSDYVFLYNDKEIDTRRVVTVRSKTGNITEVLNHIFRGTNVTYTVVDKQIILSTQKNPTPSSAYLLKGVVKDAKGEPLIGVNVKVKGSASGTITDLDGNFSLQVKEGDVIEVSYVGYATQTIKVTGRGPINVTLQEDNRVLNEVVVTALGIKRAEKALSYNVQEIKNEALTTVKDANFVNALNGKVAGITINKSGSGVGGAARVVMRGAKSIEGSNNVLYVIDGIPLFNTSVGENSGIMGEGRVGSEGIADFNPEDIASISVLSGPSAAALYGSSAANGVILITTKKGETGRARLDITSSFEFSNPFVMPRFQNTYGNKPNSYESWGEKLDKPSSYDPAKDFFRTGTNLINSATLTTGTEKNQTFLSIASTNAGGIVPNNNYERYNFTVNNNAKLLNDKMELGLGAQYIRQKDRNMVSQGQYWNPIVAAYLFPRGEEWEPIKTFERWSPSRNIPVQYWPVSEGVFGVQNPYWTAYRNVAENIRDRYIFHANVKYIFFDWLNVAGRIRMDKANTYFHRDLYASTNEKWAKPKGHFEYSNTQEEQIYADLMANFDKRFGDYSIVANVGTSFSDFRANMGGYGGPLQLIPNMFTVGNINPATGNPTEGGGDRAVRNVALFASVELGWKNMVYLTATGRNDWNSRLVNSAEPSFFYPSIGISALMSEMIDMGSSVDLLKLRASYTQVGAPVSRIGMTPGTETNRIVGGVIEANTIYPFGEFKAERTKSYEFGLSLKAFKGLSLDVTYYKSNTYNQTFLGTMPESSGYTRAYLQAGNVQNTGIEASLGYGGKKGDWEFATNVVFSHNKNEIKEMVTNYKHPNLPYTFDIHEVTKGSTILKVGGSINDIYAGQFLQKDGNGYVYVPETGEIGMSPSKTPVYLGRTTPDFNLGWNSTLSWKGLHLGIVFSGRFGGVVTSSTQAIMDRFGVSEASAIARDNGGVMIPNQGRYDAKEYYRLVGSSGEAELMGYYTYDATNVRLQQLSLGYRLPSQLFKGSVIRGVTVTLTGNNLWMIYNKAPHDPELTPSTGTYGIGNDYFMQPSLRSFGASIKLSL